MNRNYKIKQISVPEFDEENKLTGNNILLEVVSVEKIKTYVQAEGGGTLITEGLAIVCFENMEGQPKKLRIINADSELITVTKYEKHGQSSKFRGKNQANRRTN